MQSVKGVGFLLSPQPKPVPPALNRRLKGQLPAFARLPPAQIWARM